MTFSDESWLSITDAFYSAAMDGKGWYHALEGLASGTGSRAGELIGLGSERTVPFNWVTDLGADWVDEFVAIGGGDPGVNPIVRAGTDIPVLKVLASADFLSREERRTNFFMADHALRHDIPYICITPLIKESGMLVGLAVMRSRHQGEIDTSQRAIFSSIAPHVRAAVRMQMALENQGAQIMANALEPLSLAVFICDRFGSVRAMTPPAESIVSGGDPLRLRQGHLIAVRNADTRALNEALRIALSGAYIQGEPLLRTIPVLNHRGMPLVLEIVPVPRRENAFGFEPRVLVVVRGARPDMHRLRGLLRLLYALTEAEMEVALLLLEGTSPEATAAARGTSVGTVRAQIRSLYGKIGVKRQSELICKLNQLR